MDDLVRAAMAKWPNVPDCLGWLGLDARGEWYMRDEPCQAAGPFPSPKGSRVLHEQLRAFIHRNYAADAQGRWYFQNGPQRVFVELEATPWVWRLQADAQGRVGLRSHTGLPATAASAWLDEFGRLYLATEWGLGLVHSLDMDLAATEVEAGRWQPQQLAAAELPARFGFVRSPDAQRRA